MISDQILFEKAESLQQTMTAIGYGQVVMVDLQANAILVALPNTMERRIPPAEIDRLCNLILSKPRRDGRVGWDDLHDAFDEVLLPATGRHRGIFRDGTSNPIDIEIQRNKRALVRLNTRLQKTYGDEGPPSTFDRRQNAIVEKMERTAKWLCILLRKRNEIGDAEFAHGIEISAWP